MMQRRRVCDATGSGTRCRSGLLVLAALLLTPCVAAADVYYYQDADGVFHFTNVPTPDTRPFIVNSPATKPRAKSATAAPAPRQGHYDQIIREYGEMYDVEPALVKAVIQAESSFDRMAVSPKGARGLMQLMPRTARLYGVRNLHDARENIRAGVRHLRKLLDQYRNNLSFVLAAYNAGDGPVRRYRGIPPFPETRRYVTRVLQFRQEYLRAERMSQTLASNS